MKKFMILFRIIFGLALLSCSTPPLSNLNEISDGQVRTSFLLSYALKGNSLPGKGDSCFLKLVHLDSKSLFQVKLLPGKQTIQFEASEGNYRIDSLACGKEGYWSIGNFGAPQVTAYPGKINYIGNFGLTIMSSNDSHELAIDRGTREDTLDALSHVAMNRTGRWRDSLASAYSGKTWDSDFLFNPRSYIRGTVSHVIGKRVNLKAMNFAECESLEFKINPTPLGVLSYEAIYDQGHLSQLKPLAQRHSFSNDYVTCIEDKLKLFSPGSLEKITYKVNL